MFQTWLVFLFVTYNALLSGGMIIDVRLVNGPSRYEGTVEYTTDNVTWQTTCGINFDFHDARLVCEHIGAYGTNRGITNSPFGSDLGQPTTFLNCQEGHTSISDCGLVSSCSSPDMIGAAACYDDTYLGCYIDATNDRVLPGDPLTLDSTMTIDRCITHCRESMADYVYAGVENEEECYCGVAGTDYSRLGAAENGDRECQTICTGDTHSSCGGTSRIAVFQIPESSQPVTSPTIVIVTPEDADTNSDSSFQQPTTTHVISSEDDDTTTASVLTPNKPGADSSTTDVTSLSSTTPAVTMQMGETNNLDLVEPQGKGLSPISLLTSLMRITTMKFLWIAHLVKENQVPIILTRTASITQWSTRNRSSTWDSLKTKRI